VLFGEPDSEDGCWIATFAEFVGLVHLKRRTYLRAMGMRTSVLDMVKVTKTSLETPSPFNDVKANQSESIIGL